MTRPLGGTLLYNFKRFWVEVMADKTDCRFTRDLILEAVPCGDVLVSPQRTFKCDSSRGMLRNVRILQPTSWLHERPDPLVLRAKATSVMVGGGAAALEK